MGWWSGAAGDDRDLGIRLRVARQRVQDGWWRPEVYKLVCTGDPIPE